MKLLYSILVSCLLCIGQVQANLLDATSFNPQSVVVNAADNSVPIGTVIIWTKEKIPDGWLECDGKKVNDVLYPELAALMSHTPNYNGRFLQGTDTNTNVGEIKEAGLPNITGSYYSYCSPLYSSVSKSGVFRNARQGNILGADVASYGFFGTILDFNASLSNPIYGKSTTVQPPAVTVKFLIKAE